MESSKRQEGLKFHLVLPHPGIRGCSAALGNPSAPTGQEPIALLPSQAVLSFREAQLQDKMTFLEIAFYLHHGQQAAAAEPNTEHQNHPGQVQGHLSALGLAISKC